MTNKISLTAIENIEPIKEARSVPPAIVWIFALIIGTSIGYLGAVLGKQANNSPIIETAPEFTITLLNNGEELSLSDLAGKGVVLNFWASWCVPCKTEMPALEEAWNKYQDQGVLFVGINVWDEESAAIQFLDEFMVTYPNGVDLTEQIDTDYNLQGIPTTWFIFPDGTVSQKVLGPLDLESLDEAISLILPEK